METINKIYNWVNDLGAQTKLLCSRIFIDEVMERLEELDG